MEDAKEVCVGVIRVDGTLLVTDPCYVPESLRPDLVTRVDGIEPGLYPVYVTTGTVEGWGDRAWELRVRITPSAMQRSERVGFVGVDSGQMAFLSEALVPDFDHKNEWTPETVGQHVGEFSYAGACAITLDPDRARARGRDARVGERPGAPRRGHAVRRGDGAVHREARARPRVHLEREGGPRGRVGGRVLDRGRVRGDVAAHRRRGRPDRRGRGRGCLLAPAYRWR